MASLHVHRSLRATTAVTNLARPRCFLQLSLAPTMRVKLRLAAANIDFDALSSTEFDSSCSTDSVDDAEWSENIVSWKPSSQRRSRVQAPPGSVPIVILPGFGNCTQDYTEAFGRKNASLVASLESRGFKVFVPELQRKDWFRVARALLTRGFWTNSLTTEPGYTWYLKLVDETVKRAIHETGAKQVDIIGHSAGGWLGRAYIGNPAFHPSSSSSSGAGSLGSSQAASGFLARLMAAVPSLPAMGLSVPGSSSSSGDSGGGGSSSSGEASHSAGGAAATAATVAADSCPVPHPYVRSLVTLGSPQRPVPAEKGRDMTGGALSWVHQQFPGAFFASAGVRYVSVAGRTVRGHRVPGEKTKGPRTPEQYAFDSYQQVCGEGQGVEGDAVVPLSCAFLGGAHRHVLLDGVWHSMSRIGTFEDESDVVWYGSDEVVDSWLWALVEPLGAAESKLAVDEAIKSASV